MDNNQPNQWNYRLVNAIGLNPEILEDYAQALKAANGVPEAVKPEIAHQYHAALYAKGANSLLGSYIYLSERIVDPVDYERLDAKKPADIGKFAQEKFNWHFDRAKVEMYDLMQDDIWGRLKKFRHHITDAQAKFQQELVYFQTILADELEKADNYPLPLNAKNSLQASMDLSYAKRCHQRASVGLGTVNKLIKRFEKNFQKSYDEPERDYPTDHQLPEVGPTADSSTRLGKLIRELSHEPKVIRYY